MKVTITQPVMKNKQDSFWYDGQVAYIETPKWTYSLEAHGDIAIIDKNDELVYDNGKDRNDGLYIKTDKELHGLTEKGYIWENNNWFEVLGINRKTNVCESMLGDVAHEYDEAIKLLKQYAKEKIYEA